MVNRKHIWKAITLGNKLTELKNELKTITTSLQLHDIPPIAFINVEKVKQDVATISELVEHIAEYTSTDLSQVKNDLQNLLKAYSIGDFSGALISIARVITTLHDILDI